MPPKRRGGWRGRPRGRGRGGSGATTPEVSRTPTPALDSGGDEIPDGQELRTPAADEEPSMMEPENEDDGDAEDPEEDGDDDDNSEGVSTPAKKRLSRFRKPATPSRTESEAMTAGRRKTGFRGGTAWRGKNWRPKGPNSQPTQHPIDYDGNPATIENDETVLPEDAEGEKKVDKLGHLSGGREYRVRTFVIDGKGDRLYMLSTEPARCIGFRDSYLFFQKHRQLAKIVLSEEEKHSLIDRHIIPHSYKGRNIGVVTARSVYREFGARIVIGGRKITDDYYETVARENGDVEGEIAVPEDRLPQNGEEYDRKRYVAWHGASAVYHSNAPAIGGVLQPIQSSVIHQGPTIKRRKVHVTGSNWMLEHARAASNFNSLLTSLRSANKDGQYDIYTNTKHYPAIYLHTQAKWEALPSSNTDESSSEPTSTVFSTAPPTPPSYPELTPYLARNAVTIDTFFAQPPSSSFGIPGPSGVDAWGLGNSGLVDVEDDVLACLDEKCRAEFEKARHQEATWKMSWDTEANDGARRTAIRR